MHLKPPAKDKLKSANENAMLLVEDLIFNLRGFDVSIGFQASFIITVNFRNGVSLKVKEKAFSIIDEFANGSPFIFQVFEYEKPISRTASAKIFFT